LTELEGGIVLSQDFLLKKDHRKINADVCPCLERDSNLRPQCSNGPKHTYLRSHGPPAPALKHLYKYYRQSSHTSCMGWKKPCYGP